MHNNDKALPIVHVRLARDVERFPDFIAKAGMTGKVVAVEPDQIVVQLDQKLAGAEPWDNCVIWRDEVLPQFVGDVREIAA